MISSLCGQCLERVGKLLQTRYADMQQMKDKQNGLESRGVLINKKATIEQRISVTK